MKNIWTLGPIMKVAGLIMLFHLKKNFFSWSALISNFKFCCSCSIVVIVKLYSGDLLSLHGNFWWWVFRQTVGNQQNKSEIPFLVHTIPSDVFHSPRLVQIFCKFSSRLITIKYNGSYAHFNLSTKQRYATFADSREEIPSGLSWNFHWRFHSWGTVLPSSIHQLHDL